MIAKKMFIGALLFAIVGCASFRNIGAGLSAQENQAEILINVERTVHQGKYNIYLDGEFRDQMKKKGGSAKYIVPNGQRVVSIQWQGTPGTQMERSSIQVEANSNRTILDATKPGDASPIKIELGGVSDIR
jgi:hypothetical protein